MSEDFDCVSTCLVLFTFWYFHRQEISFASKIILSSCTWISFQLWSLLGFFFLILSLFRASYLGVWKPQAYLMTVNESGFWLTGLPRRVVGPVMIYNTSLSRPSCLTPIRSGVFNYNLWFGYIEMTEWHQCFTVWDCYKLDNSMDKLQ